MSDWFSFWGERNKTDTSNLDATLKSVHDIQKSNAQMQIGKGVVGLTESLTSLLNLPLYKKEKENAIKAIENSVLAGQDEIIRNLSYNTDQTLVYAARGNVAIGSPVIRERMKKGASEASMDMAMLRANADIKKANVNMQYSAKRRKTFDNAIKGVMGALMTYGMYGSNAFNSEAIDPMQVASANNTLYN